MGSKGFGKVVVEHGFDGDGWSTNKHLDNFFCIKGGVADVVFKSGAGGS